MPLPSALPFRWRWLPAILGTVLLVGCSGAPATDAPAGSAAATAVSDPVLQIASTYLADSPSDPVTGYPWYGEGERLLRPEPGGQKPWLATAVTTTDSMTWTISLRDGVRFQNGTPMTAVKVRDWLAEELKNDYDPGVYQDAQITAGGAATVIVTFPTPRTGFGVDLAYFSLPVYDLDAVKSVGKDFTKLAGLGIYTGPYQLTAVTPTRWTYTRNEHYWAGTPALDKVEMVKVNDEQAGIRAVQSGEADILDLVAPKLKPTVEAIKGLHLVTGDPALQPEFVAARPNVARAPWSDPAVRKALALAIDSEDLSAKASFGVFPPVKGVFPPGSPFGVDWMGTNTAEANQLLDQAGWIRGADGVRAKGGVRLAGTLTTSEPMLNDVAVPLAESLKQTGFALTPTLGEAQAVYDKVQAGEFDITVTYGQNFGYDGDPTALCDMFDPAVAFGAMSSVKDPQIRATCDRLATSRDPAVVEQVTRDVQRRNADQVFVIPVTGFVPASVTNDTWRSYRPNYWFDPVNWQTKAG